MKNQTKRRVGDSLGTALISLSAAFGLLLGLRSIVAAELPGVRALLGMSPMPREALGLAWSARASWPADFQPIAIERMVTMVAALLLAAMAVAVLNALITLVDCGAARRRELAVRVAVGASPLAAARLLLGPVRRLVSTAAAMGIPEKGELSAAENAIAYVTMVEGDMTGAVAFPGD